MISKFFQPKQQKKRPRNEISESANAPEDDVDATMCTRKRNGHSSELPFPTSSSTVTGSSANLAIEIMDTDDDLSPQKEKREEKIMHHPKVPAADSSSLSVNIMCNTKNFIPAMEIIDDDLPPPKDQEVKKLHCETNHDDSSMSPDLLQPVHVSVTPPNATVTDFIEHKFDDKANDHSTEKGILQKNDHPESCVSETKNISASTDNKANVESKEQSNEIEIPQKGHHLEMPATTEIISTTDPMDKKVDMVKEDQSIKEQSLQNNQTEISDTPSTIAEKVNPFAQFAFKDETKANESSTLTNSQSTWSSRHAMPVRIKTRKDISKQSQSRDKKKESSTSSSTITTKSTCAKDVGSKKGKKTQQKWVRMAELSAEEQQKITQKWHSLADPDAPLEVRRFQILVASRLHARCQEPVVRKVMQSLREVFTAEEHEKPQSENPCSTYSDAASSSSNNNKNDDDNGDCHNSNGNNCTGGLCVSTVAKADPEVLANVISSIQYYNTKAKHIVMAANEIQTRFGGLVPESEHSLKSLTGIGDVMGDLLAFVNSREAHHNSNKKEVNRSETKEQDDALAKTPTET